MSTRMDWKKLLSTKRVSEFEGCSIKPLASQYTDPRSAFEKDCDQIIYSYPFRRLQDKTQVIPFPEYDFVHTRLTHSLEVASIGRSLGKLAAPLILKELNEESASRLTASDIGALVAGACLAHDIGNPPFGHSGEDSISYHFKNNTTLNRIRPYWYLDHISRVDENYVYYKSSAQMDEKVVPTETPMEKNQFSAEHKIWNDLSNFEGNANGFRILTKNCDKGINPTAALLGTFSKYPRESFLLSNPYKNEQPPKSFTKYGFFQTEKELFVQIADELGLLKVKGTDNTDVAFHRHPLCYLMEASDDIAYGMIDFEDGCRLGLIDCEKKYGKLKLLKKNGKTEEQEIDMTPLEILTKIGSIDTSFDNTKITGAQNYKEAISYLRSKVINVLTQECYKIFEANYEDIMKGSYKKCLIDDIQSERIQENLKKMKALVRKYVYNYTPVLQGEASGFEVMNALIESFAISSDICFSCGDQETEKSQKLKSLLPDEYKPKIEKEPQLLDNWEIYERIMSVLDYVSGMTDNYAMALYRKIKGISHR